MITRHGYVDEAAIKADRIRQLASRAEYYAHPLATTGRPPAKNAPALACIDGCGRKTQSTEGRCMACRMTETR